MPVTAARLNLVKGLGPVLQIAEGYSVEIEKRCTTYWIREQIQLGQQLGSFQI